MFNFSAVKDFFSSVQELPTTGVFAHVFHQNLTTKFTQTTVMAECFFSGIGIHSGQNVNMTVKPARMNTGIVFMRTDLPKIQNTIMATFDNVVDTRLSTTISNGYGTKVSTIEHLMAALSGHGITNAVIEINGPEIPIMDGSSALFSNAFSNVGIAAQKTLHKTFVVDQVVRVENKGGYAEFIPNDERIFDVTYDFSGRFQDTSYGGRFLFNLDQDSFSSLLSDARTFGLYEDGVKLKEMGLAKGASLDNTVVLKDFEIMNKNGLRSSDELVRHKVLDAIGDIALSACPIIGTYRAYNPGHELNNKLLHALFLTQ